MLRYLQTCHVGFYLFAMIATMYYCVNSNFYCGLYTADVLPDDAGKSKRAYEIIHRYHITGSFGAGHDLPGRTVSRIFHSFDGTCH